tara:strand:- start:292 stop:573 length:282 start_codon:yes stop_codon:yes gene_type:complete
MSKFDFHLDSAPNKKARNLRAILYFVGLMLFVFVLNISGLWLSEYVGINFDTEIRQADTSQILVFFGLMFCLVVFWLSIFLAILKQLMLKLGV